MRMPLTEAQIKAQVRSIRVKANSSVTALALRSDGPWHGPERIEIDHETHRIAFCRSDLEMRELLRTTGQAGEFLVALCPFDAGALGEDVIARLAKRRVHPPEPDRILISLFQAAKVDERVSTNPLLTQALVEHAPADGYPPVAGGVLDLQTAWLELLAQVVGHRGAAASIPGLLEATLDPEFRARLERLSFELRREFFAWAELNVDRSASWMAYLVHAGRTSDLISLGLLLELVFDPTESPDAGQNAARVRLESWFGGRALDSTAARSWATASRSVIQSIQHRSGGAATVSALLSRFDALLVEFKIQEAAAKSDFSPSGFEQRVRHFAGTLERACKPLAAREFEEVKLIEAIDALQSHFQAPDQQRRIERCQMAARLACWLPSDDTLVDGASLEQTIGFYTRSGGFVDWARAVIQEGDAEPTLNKSYDTLLARVEERTETFERQFALTLAEWTRLGAVPTGDLLPIENALERLVGPLAAQVPVLLLVMDGMSLPVFRELIEDMLQRGKWLDCESSHPKLPRALIATVPSVTEISRRALFRGKLHPETSPTEQSAFGGNDRLFSLCGGQERPVLFLKGDLQTAGEAGLAAEVKEAVANTKCRVVATVLNAIDDHLSGSDQTIQRWNLDTIGPLPELLRLAAEAGRSIILTSDHGHVLEHHTTVKTGIITGADRLRTDGGAPVEGEIQITGGRIQQAIGRNELTAAWSRKIRYSIKKRGYHGGVSPLEIVVPLAVLVHQTQKKPEGWTEIAPSPFWPVWWRLSLGSKPAVSVPNPVAIASDVTADLDLFAHAKAKARSSAWIDTLLEGDIYAEQSKLTSRGAHDPKRVTIFLESMASRRGTIQREDLAERLGVPLLRLNGIVNDLARVFNVDGYEIVTLDSASGTVKLDFIVLKKQFALTDCPL